MQTCYSSACDENLFLPPFKVSSTSLETRKLVEIELNVREKGIQLIKGMLEIQEKTVDLDPSSLNNNELNVAKKPRRCHVPKCGGTNHDSRNCLNKNKNNEVLASQSSNNYVLIDVFILWTHRLIEIFLIKYELVKRQWQKTRL